MNYINRNQELLLDLLLNRLCSNGSILRAN